jgi:hypothetical protein
MLKKINISNDRKVMVEKHHEEKAYFYAKLNIDDFSGNILFTTFKEPENVDGKL